LVGAKVEPTARLAVRRDPAEHEAPDVLALSEVAAHGQFQTGALTSRFAGKQLLTTRPAPGDPEPPPGTQAMAP
jgi:hypothetical protein